MSHLHDTLLEGVSTLPYSDALMTATPIINVHNASFPSGQTDDRFGQLLLFCLHVHSQACKTIVETSVVWLQRCKLCWTSPI